MIFITFIFLLTLNNYIRATTSPVVNTVKLGRRIFHGDETPISDVPYTVFVKIKPFASNAVKICGGVILDNTTILTAAHCVQNSEGIQIIAGSSYPLTDKNVQRRVPSETILHPGYRYDSNKNTTVFDVALLKLGTALNFNGNVRAAKLPINGQNLGMMGSVCGWGGTNEAAMISPTLLCTSAHILNNSYCDSLQRKIQLSKEMICTGRSSCQGDSGSGLIHEGVVIGIVSFTLGPCNYAVPPVVYGKVVNILDFIRNNTNPVTDTDDRIFFPDSFVFE